MESINAKKFLPQAVLLTSTAAWYWSSSNNAIATQILFRHFKGIFGGQNTADDRDLNLVAIVPLAQLLTTCQLILGGILSGLPFLLLWYLDSHTHFFAVKIKASWKQPLKMYEIVIGFIHYIGSLCTNLGFGFGSASLVQCIKLLEPVGTMILMVLVISTRNYYFGEDENQNNGPTTKQEIQKILSFRKVISTITIIFGASLVLAQKSMNTNPTSIMFALCSGFCMSMRNVLKKHGSRPSAIKDNDTFSKQQPVTSIMHFFLTGIHHFARITLVAAIPSVLVSIVFNLTTNLLPIQEIISFISDQNQSSNSTDERTGDDVMSSFIKATLCHCLYNIFSITVLSMTCASIHSLLNIGKRIANVITAAIVFRIPLTIAGKVGVLLACIGAFFYNDDIEMAIKRSGVTNRRYRNIRRAAFFALSCIIFGWSEFRHNYDETLRLKGRIVGHRIENDGARQKVMSISHLLDSSSKFVVWMYPFSPPSLLSESRSMFGANSNEILICPYTTACKGQGVSINLVELTQGTFFHSYVLDHLYWKMQHFRDFAHHIQAIAMISLLQRGKKGSCVRVLGGSATHCDAERYHSYNPYANNNEAKKFDLGSTQFPFEFLQANKGTSVFLEKAAKAKSVSKTAATHNYHALSLAPNMNTEYFATYAIFEYSDPSEYPKGYYNSGEDIQSLAGAGWFPFLSSVNDKWDPLKNNYTGYYMNNCLNVGNGSIFRHFDSAIDRVQMMEKVELLSIFASKRYVTDNYADLKEYTSNVYSFGCRSTLTYKWMQEQKIKTYFSACLTLTSMYGGGLLSENGTNPSHNAMHIVDPSRNLSFAEVTKPNQKDLILIVDLVDKDAVPDSVKKRARFLSADIPKAYPKDPLLYAERMRYCYRLISQYKNYAKVIITSRIHVGLPASAMGVPVIFVSKNGWLPGGHERTGRVSGLLDVFHRVDNHREGMEWKFGDLEGSMPPNPGNHYADRFRASFWNRLKRNPYYSDAARLFGRIPMQRLGTVMEMYDIQNVFHFIMNEEDLNVWYTKRAVESVLYFHPNAQVYVHVDSVNYGNLDWNNYDVFAESGYHVTVLKLNTHIVAKSAEKLLGQDFSGINLTLGVTAGVLLHEYGGVFVSKYTYVTRKLPSNLDLGFTEQSNGDVIMMISKKGSTDVLKAASSYTSHDKSKRLKQSSAVAWNVNILSKSQSAACLGTVWWEMPVGDDFVAFSVVPSAFVDRVFFHGTRCFDMLEKHCIYCDETTHWSYAPGVVPLSELYM